MKSLIRNTLLPLFNFTIIALAGYMLYLDFTSTLQPAGTVQIGTITFKQRIAERKYTQQVIWEKLQNNSPVYNFDAIRTDAGSLAVINLDDGTAIELEEETMVVLQQSQSGLDIDFEQGALSAKKSGSAKGGLNIKSGGAVVALAAGDLNLSKSKDESLNVNVQSGNASLIVGGETTQIDPTKAAKITAAGAEVQDISIRLTAPAASKNIIAQGGATVDFSWSLDKREKSTLQISTERGFSSIAVTRTANAQDASASVTLDQGIYYWRVTSEGQTSPSRRIAVISENPPIILRPFSKQQFTYRDSKPLITFKWNGAESAYAYVVEVSSNSNMNGTIQRYQTHDTLVSTDELGPGTYYCRITALYNLGSEKKQVESRVTEFTVSRSSEIKPPQLISPYNNKKLLVKNTSTVFNWKKVSEAASYILQIKNEDTGRSIVNSKVNLNFYTYTQTFTTGTYTWEVVSVAPDGSRSQASGEYTFRISSKGKITPLTPENGKKYMPNEPVRFTWKDENQGQRYQLQIARDPLFATTAVNRTLTTRSATISDLGGGSYYWKINLLNAQNSTVVSSQRSQFSVVDRLIRPRLVAPPNRKFAWNASSVNFNWSRVPNATHYTIEIYKKGFPKPTRITSSKLTGTSFNYNLRDLKDGDYFWTVQATMQKGSQVILRSSKAQESFSKEKKEIPEITKPEIKSPSTIYIR